MKDSIKKSAVFCFAAGAVAAVLAALLAVLVVTVDVSPIGPEESSVGLSAFNARAAAFFAYDPVAHTVTDWLGYLAVGVIIFYFIKGAVQLIKRRSLRGVDRHIILLGCFYAVLLLIYVLFDLFPLNYRPLILDIEKGLEPSFPSSHTMLAMCVFLTLPIQPEFSKSGRKILKIAVLSASVALSVVTVGGRLISGVHWATDVIGGVLISAALIAFYRGAFICVVPSGKESETPTR